MQYFGQIKPLTIPYTYFGLLIIVFLLKPFCCTWMPSPTPQLSPTVKPNSLPSLTDTSSMKSSIMIQVTMWLHFPLWLMPFSLCHLFINLSVVQLDISCLWTVQNLVLGRTWKYLEGKKHVLLVLYTHRAPTRGSGIIGTQCIVYVCWKWWINESVVQIDQAFWKPGTPT